MKLLEKIIEQAKKDVQTIVLPEGKDQRIIDAARALKKENIVNIGNIVNIVQVCSQVFSIVFSFLF